MKSTQMWSAIGCFPHSWLYSLEFWLYCLHINKRLVFRVKKARSVAGNQNERKDRLLYNQRKNRLNARPASKDFLKMSIHMSIQVVIRPEKTHKKRNLHSHSQEKTFNETKSVKENNQMGWWHTVREASIS